MLEVEPIFEGKIPDLQKLEPYGFIKNAAGWLYRQPLPEPEMELQVQVTSAGNVSVCVFDTAIGEEYDRIFQNVPGSEYLAGLIEAAEDVLQQIAAACFTLQSAFTGAQSRDLIEKIRSLYGDALEFLWKDTPDAAIWRRKDSRKWYGLLMRIPAGRIGREGEEMLEILNVKAEKEDVQALVDHRSIYPAYHMSRKTWMSIVLDGSVHTERLLQLVDNSYELAGKGKRK